MILHIFCCDYLTALVICHTVIVAVSMHIYMKFLIHIVICTKSTAMLSDSNQVIKYPVVSTCIISEFIDRNNCINFTVEGCSQMTVAGTHPNMSKI